MLIRQHKFNAMLLIMSLALTLLTSCAPSVNPALKKRVDSYPTARSPSDYDTDQTFTAPMPWAVGQYVVHKTTDGEMRPSITRTSIIAQEAEGWVIEIHSITYTSESLAQLYVVGFDQGTKVRSFKDLEVKWTKIKDADGKVTQVNGNTLAFAQSLESAGVVQMTMKPPQRSSEPLKVPAGRFKGATLFEGSGKLGGLIDVSSQGWYHPAVPIFGSVRTTSSTPRSMMELIEFGLSGATSEF